MTSDEWRDLAWERADEIDRLRAALRRIADLCDCEILGEAADEIERLRTDYAFADAEIRQLRALLYRCQVAWVDDDSDLAAEVRTALEGKP